ncbi:MAG: hypothetical protein ACM3X5_06655 [Bacillota bacterium]
MEVGHFAPISFDKLLGPADLSPSRHFDIEYARRVAYSVLDESAWEKAPSMRSFIASFIRAADGSWICVSAATFRLENGEIRAAPGDRFAPGEIVLGIDVARALDFMDRQHAADC